MAGYVHIQSQYSKGIKYMIIHDTNEVKETSIIFFYTQIQQKVSNKS